jgi:hypothetical protein
VLLQFGLDLDDQPQLAAGVHISSVCNLAPRANKWILEFALRYHPQRAEGISARKPRRCQGRAAKS